MVGMSSMNLKRFWRMRRATVIGLVAVLWPTSVSSIVNGLR